jgi:hypothetical protein
MRRDAGRVWKEKRDPRKPDFYLTEDEKKDGESSRITRWLELADRMFENDDCDLTPSAA